MIVKMRYRLINQIYYNDYTIEISDDITDISFIIQQAKFELQKEFSKIVAGIFIQKSDIQKYRLK